jgi:diketogulonate reductase-like aldo/keto reductase
MQSSRSQTITMRRQSQVAIAWVAVKGSLPIIGPRTVAQLEDNLAPTKLQLTREQLARLDEVSAIPDIFPHRLLNSREIRQRIAGGNLDLLESPVTRVS